MGRMNTSTGSRSKLGKKNKGKGFEGGIASRAEDFSRWYIDVVKKADLADHSDVKGCMVIKPYGYGIWENIQQSLDKRIKATGHLNAYFPLFVPESFLKKEAEHVEGFAPEVPWVTHVGEEPLDERLAIRPTSEAIIGATFARWIQSYRDLPLLINQWANVVRWEKRTRLFLRTSEFLWQEGHTCHRTEAEAREETIKMLGVYHDFMRDEMAIPTIRGIKSEREKFAGAVDTYTVEAMMGDGWALQAGTSHFLGQNFARAFEIKFLDEDNEHKFVHQTSWGVSTRLVGALIMSHGDEKGLRVPPRIAPIQAVIIPILRKDSAAATLEVANKMADDLRASDIRVKVDDRDWLNPGFKFHDWELRGVPVRIEIGPRDIEANQCMVARRDTGEKEALSLDGLAAKITEMLDAVQAGLLAEAEAFREANTREVRDFEEFKVLIAEGKTFVRAPWDGTTETEDEIKALTKATIRCIPLEGGEADRADRDILSGAPAKHIAIFARAY